MSETPFIKFYPSDFIGGTAGLSPAERGIYMTLLCLIYEEDGPIERDDARLARNCGAPKATFLRILESLIQIGKITETDGMLSNNRAERAIVDRQNRSQNSTIAANQRWKAHGKKSKQKQMPNDAPAMLPQCVVDASQSQSQNIEDTDVSSLRDPALDLPDFFEDFWDQYPHRGGAKKGKTAARKSWDRAIKAKANPSQIIQGAMRYANDAQVIRGYAKDPATWLNQQCWNDDVERGGPPSGGGGGGSGGGMVAAFAAVAARRTNH